MKNSRFRKNQPFRHGFTLIELLVVVSIIALLVSILMPALRIAKEQATGALCLTRQKRSYCPIDHYPVLFDSLLPAKTSFVGLNVPARRTLFTSRLISKRPKTAKIGKK